MVPRGWLGKGMEQGVRRYVLGGAYWLGGMLCSLEMSSLWRWETREAEWSLRSCVLGRDGKNNKISCISVTLIFFSAQPFVCIQHVIPSCTMQDA